MNNPIEFYRRGGDLIASCQSTLVPRQGEYINIQGAQWRVAYVAWAIDTNSHEGTSLRANVELEKVKDDEVGPIVPAGGGGDE